MSNNFCTTCGKVISGTARFCRFCGSPIKVKTPRSAPRSQQVAPSIPTAAPPPGVEKIPDKIVETLYARRRSDEIKGELKKMLEEISELSKKVEIGLIEADESKEQTSQLQARISALQEEKAGLQFKPLELEELTENEKKWQERLEKLEEKNRAQAVSRDVYSSLHEEYTSERASVQQKAAIETRKAKRWLVDLQKDIRGLDTQIEQVKVRGDIEEVRQPDILSRIEKMKTERTKKSTAAEILTEILGKR